MKQHTNAERTQRLGGRPRTSITACLVAGVLAAMLTAVSPVAAQGADAAGRLDVPFEHQVTEARVQIRELFSDEYTVTERDELAKLAMKLLELSDDKGQTPVSSFALLAEAIDQATAAGDVQLLEQIVNRLISRFKLDPLATRWDHLKAIERTARAADQHADLAEAMMQLSDDAVREDRYDIAVPAATAAHAAARPTRQADLLERSREQMARARRLDRLYEHTESARQTLADDADDPQANTELAEFHLIHKGAIEQALPYMVRSDNEQWQALASAEASADASLDARLAAGDAWWDWGQQQGEDLEMKGYRRSVGHYRDVVDQLEGLAKLRVEQRLAEYAKLAADKREGRVVEGDVALASRGAKVAGDSHMPLARLIDGEADDVHAYASAKWPSDWRIVLNDTYSLQEIRFRLYDGDERAYRYKLDVSEDGRSFTTVADRSDGKWQSWQRITFDPRPVRVIRIRGLQSTATAYFHIIEVQAFCNPPKKG